MNNLEEAMEQIHEGIIALIRFARTFDERSPEAQELSDMIHDLDGIIDRIDTINQVETRKEL